MPLPQPFPAQKLIRPRMLDFSGAQFLALLSKAKQGKLAVLGPGLTLVPPCLTHSPRSSLHCLSLQTLTLPSPAAVGRPLPVKLSTVCQRRSCSVEHTILSVPQESFEFVLSQENRFENV